MDKYEGLDVQALNAHIAGLIHRRRQLDNQIKRLRSQRSRLVNGTVVGSNRSGTQDAKAVPTVELKPYVDAALREFTTTQLARRANVAPRTIPVSYTHLRAHETPEHLVCRLLLEKKKQREGTC